MRFFDHFAVHRPPKDRSTLLEAIAQKGTIFRFGGRGVVALNDVTGHPGERITVAGEMVARVQEVTSPRVAQLHGAGIPAVMHAFGRGDRDRRRARVGHEHAYDGVGF